MAITKWDLSQGCKICLTSKNQWYALSIEQKNIKKNKKKLHAHPNYAKSNLEKYNTLSWEKHSTN